VLLLDKPVGLSSNAALQRARKLLSARKAGHTGSLDPMASGLLPICLGEATKLAGYLLQDDKRYRTTIRLGQTTDTADAAGRVLKEAPVPELEADALEGVLGQFRGILEQTPPMYSALKQSGVRLYDLARQGIEVPRVPRRIEIYSLTLVGFSRERLELDVHCSKGTYIRVLAEDIGNALGCGGHVEALRRTAVGSWDLSGAHSLGELEALHPEDRLGQLKPVDSPAAGLPKANCCADASRRLSLGQTVPAPVSLGTGPVRLYDTDDVFLGIGESMPDGTIAPRRMVKSA
jgi:tRNA pseudouridine55 synthase